LKTAACPSDETLRGERGNGKTVRSGSTRSRGGAKPDVPRVKRVDYKVSSVPEGGVVLEKVVKSSNFVPSESRKE